jgi:hypothetical protein
MELPHPSQRPPATPVTASTGTLSGRVRKVQGGKCMQDLRRLHSGSSTFPLFAASLAGGNAGIFECLPFKEQLEFDAAVIAAQSLVLADALPARPADRL